MKTFLSKKISTIFMIFCVLFLAVSMFFSNPQVAHAQVGTASFASCFHLLPIPHPDISCIVGSVLYNYVWLLVGSQVYFGAYFFERALDITMKFSQFVTGMSGIRVAWSVFRDLMNIAFIFLLLYAAIRMILNLGKHEGIIKGVITAGLLINFSFFYTSIIIDVSNIFVAEIHDAIVSIGTRRPTGPPTNNNFMQAYGISAVFMKGLGMAPGGIPQQIISIPGTYELKLIQQIIFTSIAYLIVTFIFYTMGFLLIVRFLVLVLLLITSPVSVMGGFFPQFSSKWWWDALIGQVLFAPAMLLLLLITALILESPGFSANFFLITP